MWVAIIGVVLNMFSSSEKQTSPVPCVCGAQSSSAVCVCGAQSSSVVCVCVELTLAVIRIYIIGCLITNILTNIEL